MATKTELYSFIESNKQAALRIVDNKMKEQFDHSIKALLAKPDVKAKLDTLVSCYDTIIKTEDEIDKIISSNSNKTSGNSMHNRLKLHYYNDEYVRRYHSSPDLVYYFAEAFWRTTDEYDKWRELRDNLSQEVRKEYNTILDNLKIMTAKKGLEYLAELGFNVSCFDDKEAKPCNIAVPVDTKKLLLDHIQKPVEA
jgi:hypothetical protein